MDPLFAYELPQDPQNPNDFCSSRLAKGLCVASIGLIVVAGLLVIFNTLDPRESPESFATNEVTATQRLRGQSNTSLSENSQILSGVKSSEKITSDPKGSSSQTLEMGLGGSTPSGADHQAQTTVTRSLIVVSFSYYIKDAGPGVKQWMTRVISDTPEVVIADWKALRENPAEFVKKRFPKGGEEFDTVSGAALYVHEKEPVSF